MSIKTQLRHTPGSGGDTTGHGANITGHNLTDPTWYEPTTRHMTVILPAYFTPKNNHNRGGI